MRVPTCSGTARQCTTIVERPARAPRRIVRAKSSERRRRSSAGSTAVGQADSSSRPLRRRAARIARPARVRIRSRKPCVLARRRLFGWKVRFDTSDSTRLIQVTARWRAVVAMTRHPWCAAGTGTCAGRQAGAVENGCVTVRGAARRVKPQTLACTTPRPSRMAVRAARVASTHRGATRCTSLARPIWSPQTHGTGTVRASTQLVDNYVDHGARGRLRAYPPAISPAFAERSGA